LKFAADQMIFGDLKNQVSVDSLEFQLSRAPLMVHSFIEGATGATATLPME
jgi:hypothetical protein